MPAVSYTRVGLRLPPAALADLEAIGKKLAATAPRGPFRGVSITDTILYAIRAAARGQ